MLQLEPPLSERLVFQRRKSEERCSPADSLRRLRAFLAGILISLHIFFRPTSLFNTLLMLVLLFGGLGLIVRSLKAAPPAQDEGQKSPQ